MIMQFWFFCLAFFTTCSLFGQSQAITSLVIDGDQNIYIGSSDGLNMMTAESRQITRVLDHVDVEALAWSKRHGVLVGCNRNEIWNADGRKILTLDDPKAQIRCMMISNGLLWVGTDAGVFVVSLTREEVTKTYTSYNSALPSNHVNTMYADGSGIKWIGTDHGVVRIEGERKWHVYEQDTRFTAIAGNIEGTWLAGDKEMWLVDPFNRWTPTDVKDGLSKGEMRSVASDKQGRVYLLSDIFVQFDPYTDNIVPINDQSATTVAENIALAVDNADQLWVATKQEGLKMIDPEVELAEKPLLGTLVLGHPSCAGSMDGSIEARVEGGRPPYQYYWNDDRITGNTATGLGAGTYEILITDGNGNSYRDEATLHDPAPLHVNIRMDEKAEGITLEADADGGRGDLSFLWSNGEKARRLAVETAAAYSVTVADANGCTQSAEYTIEPKALVQASTLETPELFPLDTVQSVTVENVKQLNVKALNVGQVLRIEQLQFQADSTNIQPSSYSVLDGIASFLQQNENIVIEIGGHTNGLPDDAYCDKLSTERAQSVAEYLYAKGIPRDQITYHGYGKREPIATNATVEGRRRNQRVEVKILQL